MDDNDQKVVVKREEANERGRIDEAETKNRREREEAGTTSRRTEESVKAGDAASGPRGTAESREVRRETEGLLKCKRSILQRALEARHRDPIAAGDGGARQTKKLSARE